MHAACCQVPCKVSVTPLAVCPFSTLVAEYTCLCITVVHARPFLLLPERGSTSQGFIHEAGPKVGPGKVTARYSAGQLRF